MDLEIKEKLTKLHWCPPNLVLQRWNELIQTYGFAAVDSKRDFKKAREMRAVAIAMLGFHLADGNDYLMQAALEKEQSPDVFTLYQTEHPVWTNYQTVEVVTYESHTNIDVGQFILNTKLLNKNKSYDEDTIILCEIHKGDTFINWAVLYKQLAAATFKPKLIYIVGELRDSNEWMVSQVWPEVAHVKFNLVQQANSYPIKRPYIFFPGRGETFDVKHLSNVPPPNKYQIFGLNEVELEKKYKIK
jgi:hypothetical protein